MDCPYYTCAFKKSLLPVYKPEKIEIIEITDRIYG